MFGKKLVSFQNGAATTIPSGSVLIFPYGVYINDAGVKFVAGEMNGKIVSITSAGVSSTFVTISGAYVVLYDITGDAFGNLFVTDGSYHKVHKIDSAGTVTVFAGTGTKGNTDVVTDALSAAIDTPWGIALDPTNGDVFFACSGSGSQRVQMIRNTDKKLVPLTGGT